MVCPDISYSILFFLVKKKTKMLETKIKEINIRRIKIIKLATTV
tara:strand:+ start:316 stop:447 length:132 start_codon:yes stop_codon:yes gene_type:complete